MPVEAGVAGVGCGRRMGRWWAKQRPCGPFRTRRREARAGPSNTATQALPFHSVTSHGSLLSAAPSCPVPALPVLATRWAKPPAATTRQPATCQKPTTLRRLLFEPAVPTASPISPLACQPSPPHQGRLVVPLRHTRSADGSSLSYVLAASHYKDDPPAKMPSTASLSSLLFIVPL